MPRPAKGFFLALIPLILAIGLFLRVYPLPLEALDGDELFSLRVAMAPAAQAWDMIRQDLVHPPLYYFVLKAVLSGSSAPDEYDLRGLSLFAGAASIVAAAAFGFLVPAFRVPSLLAAFLASLNAVHIFYSQQARSYALYSLLGGILLLWRALERRCQARRAYWSVGAILMSLIVWTHYAGAFMCLACALSMVPARSAPLRCRLLPFIPLALAGLLFLTWLIPEIDIYRSKNGLAQNLGWQGVAGLFDLKMTFADYIGVPDFRGGTTAALLVGLVFGACAWFPASQPVDASVAALRRALLLMSIVPPAALWLFTRWPFRLPVFSERHVLPCLIPALLLVSLGAHRLAALAPSALAGRLLFASAGLFLGFLQIGPVLRYWPGPLRTPFHYIARDIQSLQPQPLPIFHTYPYGTGEALKFYFRHTPRPISVLPDSASPSVLPDRLILVYRPSVAQENRRAQALLPAYQILHDRYYSGARSPRFGVRVLVLSRHPTRQGQVAMPGLSAGIAADDSLVGRQPGSEDWPAVHPGPNNSSVQMAADKRV